MRVLFVVILVLGLIGITGQPAYANTMMKDNRTRVVLSLRQSVLIDQVSMATCFAMSGIERSRALIVAREAIDGYATTLDGLVHGHEWLGLAAEKNSGLALRMSEVSKSSQTFLKASSQILAGDLHSVIMTQFLAQRAFTRIQTDELAQQITSVHLQDTMSDREKATLLAAARHWALSQALMTEFCLATSNIGGNTTKTSLSTSVEAFETGFVDLMHVDPQTGVPSNARVIRNLRTARLFWDKMRPVIADVAHGKQVTAKDIAKVLRFNTSVLKQLNQAVEGYLVSN